MIEDIAGERLAAGPGESPKRRRHRAARQTFLGGLPNRSDLGGEVEAELRHQRRCRYRRVASDEDSAVHADQPRWPQTIPTSMSQPTARLERNLRKQSAGLSVATRAACQASGTPTAARPAQKTAPNSAACPAADHRSSAAP